MAEAYLEIYVESDCFVCARSEEIADSVRAAFADVDVRVIAVPGGSHRSLVVAAPTYVLNGQVVSLGNPDPDVLHQELRELRDSHR